MIRNLDNEYILTKLLQYTKANNLNMFTRILIYANYKQIQIQESVSLIVNMNIFLHKFLQSGQSIRTCTNMTLPTHTDKRICAHSNTHTHTAPS